MSELTKLAETKDIGPGEAIAVEAGGQRIAVFNVNGTICAIGDTCTHRGSPLSHGKVEGWIVTCPWHGAKIRYPNGRRIEPTRSCRGGEL